MHAVPARVHSGLSKAPHGGTAAHAPFAGRTLEGLVVVTAAATTGLHSEQVKNAGLTQGPRQRGGESGGARPPPGPRGTVDSEPSQMSSAFVHLAGMRLLYQGPSLPSCSGSLVLRGAAGWASPQMANDGAASRPRLGRVSGAGGLRADGAVVWQPQQDWWQLGCPLLDLKQ